MGRTPSRPSTPGWSRKVAPAGVPSKPFRALSNAHAREAFRRHSYFSDLAQGVIAGLGPMGYELALEAAMRSLRAGP